MKTRTTYLLDRVPGVFEGVTIDLTRVQIDVYGAHWTWTGLVTPDRHVPLMQSGTDTPLPLDEVYATYGPLIPAPAPLTAAAVRTVLLDDAPAELRESPRPALPTRPDPLAYGPSGYVCGCGKPAHSNLTPCQADEEPKPAEPAPAVTVPSPSTFARFLARIRGGAR